MGSERDRYEIIRGERVDLRPKWARESFLMSHLFHRLILIPKTERHGDFYGHMRYQLDRDGQLALRPDLSFVTFEKWSRKYAIPDVESWGMIPDWVIEFASPGESIPDLQPRISDYLDAGVQCVWCIWVEMNQIHICTSAAKCVILSIGDELTGAPFIPGFRMPVADLFQPTFP